MKSPPPTPTTINDDDGDDIFGPPRTYATGYCPPKNRPSMISAKYRQKEERRKVLKISINKLKKIEDPEASLCRSVLINNTVKRLQKEARDEKLHKQQLNYPPRCYDNDTYLNIKSEFIKNELKTSSTTTTTSSSVVVAAAYDETNDDLKANDFDSYEPVSAKSVLDLVTNDPTNQSLNNNNNNNNNISSKRTFDDLEDCDVQDVLSQFYMPPTPRMLTSIDDDEDVNVVDDDDEPIHKRPKLYHHHHHHHDMLLNNNDSEMIGQNTRLTATAQPQPQQQQQQSYNTCGGQASMFREMQTNGFFSLIASLET